MPRPIPPPSTIHRSHMSYPHESSPRCVNVYHNAIDCYSAGLSLAEYCNPCHQFVLRNNPDVTLNGAKYVLDTGKGRSKPHYAPGWLTPIYEEIWVWRCWEWLEYTAPAHVARELDERMALGEEVRAAERAAGWPS